MWGLGCVFAEMILYCKEFNTSEDGFDPQIDRYIMPGGSCFPLSPCKSMTVMSKKQDKECIVARDDQLLKYPSEDHLCFITDESTIDYINSVASRSNNIKNLLPSRFSGCPNQIIGLLIGMLTFNPYFRMSASECLKNSLFDKIRNNEIETTNVPSQVVLDGFEMDAVDSDSQQKET